MLAIPKQGDAKSLTRIGDLIAEAIKNKEPIPDADTVRARVRPKGGLRDRVKFGPYLLDWLSKRKGLSKNTHRSYESHIRLYLVPVLGEIWLDELEGGDFTFMVERIEEFNDQIEDLRQSTDPDKRALVRYRRPVGIASMHRIVATARKALNDAMYGEARLITFNPAVKVELPPEVRPKPLVWTDARVARWVETGEIPGKVMVWTPEQIGAFLDFIAHHRLYAFFHLLAHAGLRRGEGLGQYWVDFDEDTGTLAIRFKLLQVG